MLLKIGYSAHYINESMIAELEGIDMEFKTDKVSVPNVLMDEFNDNIEELKDLLVDNEALTRKIIENIIKAENMETASALSDLIKRPRINDESRA